MANSLIVYSLNNLSSYVLTMIYGYWLKFSGSARVFISRTVLLAVYYFILTPVAVLYRLFNDNPLKLARRSSEKSYFTHREQTFSAADLEKMW